MEAKTILASADEALSSLSLWRTRLEKEEETLTLGFAEMDSLEKNYEVDDCLSRKAESEFTKEVEESAQASLNASRANADRAKRTLDLCAAPLPEAGRLQTSGREEGGASLTEAQSLQHTKTITNKYKILIERTYHAGLNLTVVIRRRFCFLMSGWKRRSSS